jgi:hypothetical protein
VASPYVRTSQKQFTFKENVLKYNSRSLSIHCQHSGIQAPVTAPYSEPDESSPHPLIPFHYDQLQRNPFIPRSS